MASLTLSVMLTTVLAACLGLPAAVNLDSRRFRVVGRSLLMVAAGGGIYIGFAANWTIAAFVLGGGLFLGLVLMYMFVSGGSF